jgi:N-methylhydantoinase B
MNSIQLSLFSSRIDAVCDEMGALLQRAAFSTNIKDRLDFSCAVFDPEGALCAQAAHIPVHLGSMAYAMRDIVSQFSWQRGDMVVLNDPYMGGTHLPDVTVIAPLFSGDKLIGFVANRAHHADIGANAPGSMPISTHIEQEGMIISPRHLLKAGKRDELFFDEISRNLQDGERALGDFVAQISSCKRGLERLGKMVSVMGMTPYLEALKALNDYAERLAVSALSRIKEGVYHFSDYMDGDGVSEKPVLIQVEIRIEKAKVSVDFGGSSPQVTGNINCPISVVAAAVYYVFCTLMAKNAPTCAGLFRPIALFAPEGSLLNACYPAAVAAGNVETSSRVVDVVIGALAKALPDEMPAASHGTMNNLAMGSREQGAEWDYYETIGGGMGASSCSAGLSAIQTHMTNTLNTPIESLEMNFPVRINRYATREGSGGAGLHRGGEGIIREYQFLKAAQVTLLSERRIYAPWGLKGGEPGAKGVSRLNGQLLPPKIALEVKAGDLLTIETPGGGGWGAVKAVALSKGVKN